MLQHQHKKNTNKMGELDDLCALSLMTLTLLMLWNLIFSNITISSFKTHEILRTRASASSMIHEIGKNPKKYYRMCDMSFWKLHDALKKYIDKKDVDVSRRNREKYKRHNHAPNRLACSSLYLSIALRTFACRFLSGISLAHDISPTEVQHIFWKVVDTAHCDPRLSIEFIECHVKQKQIAVNSKKLVQKILIIAAVLWTD